MDLNFLRTLMNPNPTMPQGSPFNQFITPPAAVAPPPIPPVKVDRKNRFRELLPSVLMGLGQAIATNNPSAVGTTVASERQRREEERRRQSKAKFVSQFLAANGKQNLAQMAMEDPDLAIQLSKGFDGDLPMSFKEFQLAQQNPDYAKTLYAKKKGLRLRSTPEGGIEFSMGGDDEDAPNQTFLDTSGRESAKALAKMREESKEASEMANTIDLAKNIITGGPGVEGLQTGALTPITGKLDALAAAFGITEGSHASKVEQLDAASKELGIQQMRLIGGNDTERELMISIQTTVSPGKRPETNLKLLEKKLKAIEILQERPVHYTNWVNKYGSLEALDEQGRTSEQAWRQYQREQFGVGETNLKSFREEQKIKASDGEYRIRIKGQ